MLGGLLSTPKDVPGRRKRCGGGGGGIRREIDLVVSGILAPLGEWGNGTSLVRTPYVPSTYDTTKMIGWRREKKDPLFQF